MYPSISEVSVANTNRVTHRGVTDQDLRGPNRPPRLLTRFLPSPPDHDSFGDKSGIERSKGSQATANVQMLALKLVPKMQALKNVINPSCMYHLCGSLVTTGRL